MGLFGWDLPPGCTMADIERAAGGDGPCEVCGEHVDDCICPECPTCGVQGDPGCYEAHSLVRTTAQRNGRALLDAVLADEARRESEGLDDLAMELAEPGRSVGGDHAEL